MLRPYGNSAFSNPSNNFDWLNDGIWESPSEGIDLASSNQYDELMKTEELLRYEAEYRAMQEVFGTFLLVFDFSKPEGMVNKPFSPGVSKSSDFIIPQKCVERE